MNGYRILREVCNMLKLSRRAIQGYEKIGLIKPTAKNKYGHLLYDEQTVNQIAGIQYCQKLGLGLKEILALTKGKQQDVCEKLEDHLVNLEIKKDELDYLINKTDEIIEAMQNSNDNFLDVIYEKIKEDLYK